MALTGAWAKPAGAVSFHFFVEGWEFCFCGKWWKPSAALIIETAPPRRCKRCEQLQRSQHLIEQGRA